MSQWSKIKVVVKDTALFKTCCEKHGVSYELNKNNAMRMQRMAVYAILKDRQGLSMHTEAYLCARANEGYQMVIDNDPHWSSITARVGQGGGLIMRDYTQGMLTKGLRRQGGMVQNTFEKPAKEGGNYLFMRVSAP